MNVISLVPHTVVCSGKTDKMNIYLSEIQSRRRYSWCQLYETCETQVWSNYFTKVAVLMWISR